MFFFPPLHHFNNIQIISLMTPSKCFKIKRVLIFFTLFLQCMFFKICIILLDSRNEVISQNLDSCRSSACSEFKIILIYTELQCSSSFDPLLETSFSSSPFLSSDWLPLTNKRLQVLWLRWPYKDVLSLWHVDPSAQNNMWSLSFWLTEWLHVLYEHPALKQYICMAEGKEKHDGFHTFLLKCSCLKVF